VGHRCVRDENGGTSSGFDRLVDRYFDSYFKFHPTDGTDAGFHQYDRRVEDFSSQAIHAEIAELKNFQSEFSQFSAGAAFPGRAWDFEYLENMINARLLDLEAVQPWRKDPDFYTHAVSRGIFLLMKRKFAPAEERLRSLIAREKQIPGVLQSGSAISVILHACLRKWL